MGVPQRLRRLSTPAALALVLALAGSTSSASRSNGTPSALTASVATPAATAVQSPASVTAVGPVDALAPTGPAYEPAVHIASSGPVVRHAVRVDIADVLLQAYRSAADAAPTSCHLPVSLLAAIGEVESGSLVGRPMDAEHRTSVLGPALNGQGFAAIRDTDRGRWDGDAVWDRAVGPMQFIPGTWRTFGADGDGDGVADPQDVEDAAAATAAYLCYGGRDLSRPADLRAAILSYNHSEAYLNLVSTYQQRYAGLGLDNDVTLTGLPSSISLVPSLVPALVAAPVSSLGTGQPVAKAPGTHTVRPAGAPAKPAGADTKPKAGTDAAAAPVKPAKTPSKPAEQPTPAPSAEPTPKPDDTPPADTPPADTPPADTPPADTPPADTPPADTPPDDTPPDETPPDETPPAETPPAETPPADTPPADTPPADTPPADTPPTDGPTSEPAPEPSPDGTDQPACPPDGTETTATTEATAEEACPPCEPAAEEESVEDPSVTCELTPASPSTEQ